MFFLLGSLLAGFSLARLKVRPQSSKKVVAKLGDIAFFCLLFFIGCSLGGNSEVMLSLPVVGLKALILSFSSVVSSVLFVLLLVKLGGNKI